MSKNFISTYQELGVYGLINLLQDKYPLENNRRIIAYNLLKAGYQVAKKSKADSLACLPLIALDLSRHESIYRMAALLLIELGEFKQAIKYISYLYYYYKDNSLEPHKQYKYVEEKILESYLTQPEYDQAIESMADEYRNELVLNNIKENSDILPKSDPSEQKVYFEKLYKKYNKETVIASVVSDSRFSDRQKAVILIRASRAVGQIAEEGPSVESSFANKAVELDTSDSVINNAYQAFLRAGDVNQVVRLKEEYPQLANIVSSK